MRDIPGLTRLENAAVSPTFATMVTVAFTPDAAFGDGQLPPELVKAAPERQRQFLAGRYCALAALRVHSGRCPVHVGRGPGGEPLWPAGLTGSVTHTRDFAAAAVAGSGQARSIGIDTEEIVTTPSVGRLSSLVLLAAEPDLGGPALDNATRFTLVFSAKESLFKCLYPLVRRRFYYPDVALRALDLTSGTFAAELVTTLSAEFRAGWRVTGKFVIDGRRVHTGVWVAAPA
jgi:enterobactin synthetase component D